jgi:glucose/arabinose dehydrogenase
MGHISTLAGVVALTSLFAHQVAAQSCPGVTGRFQPKMGSGYRYSVLATGLRNPRHIAVDSAGNLLVTEGATQGVRRLVLQDQGDIVCVQSNTQIITGSVSQTRVYRPLMNKLTDTKRLDKPRDCAQRRWQDALHLQPCERDGILL